MPVRSHVPPNCSLGRPARFLNLQDHLAASEKGVSDELARAQGDLGISHGGGRAVPICALLEGRLLSRGRRWLQGTHTEEKSILLDVEGEVVAVAAGYRRRWKFGLAEEIRVRLARQASLSAGGASQLGKRILERHHQTAAESSLFLSCCCVRRTNPLLSLQSCIPLTLSPTTLYYPY